MQVSRMGELGVRDDVIDRCLNYKEARRVTRTYQREELLADRAEAFCRLGERLEILSRGADSRVMVLVRTEA